MRKKTKKPWTGRFNKQTDPLVETFTESLSFDSRLALYDIAGSCVHTEMLEKIGILKPAEAKKIIKALHSIADDISAGKAKFHVELEDIHMNIEAELANRIGILAGKLHTGRSRNDQVALDERLYLRDVILSIKNGLTNLQKSLILLAEKYNELVVPGFTHLQFAMPVLAAHHLLAYVEMFERDIERLRDQYKRVNVLPLGSAALAGSGFPLDRDFVAEALGFDKVSRNSMDSVADRDYLIEFLSAAAITAMHISRLSEDFILWMSQPFGFVDIDDAFCTGSSLMPNKKNPDVLEIARGKCARIYGDLFAMLTLLKGLPMTYNRDLQEDKEPVFDAADTLSNTIAVVTKLIPTITFNENKITMALTDDFLLATDWADYLVKKGLPFRDAHEIIGKAVALAVKNNCGITELSLKNLKKLSPLFDNDIFKISTPMASVEAKSSPGSTNPASVKKEIKRWKRVLNKR